MSNGYKLAAQRKRAMAIVGAIDAELLRQGVDIIDQAGKVVLLLLGWTDADWWNAAQCAGLKTPPSKETQGLVSHFYGLRAKAPLQTSRAS